MRVFREACSEALDHLLQNPAKHTFLSQNRVWGPTSEHSGPKNTVWPEKFIFWPFSGIKCGFLVIAALKPWIICSKTLQNTFSESSTLKIEYGTLQLTTQARKHRFRPKNGIFWPFLGKKCGFLVITAPQHSI